MSKLTRLDAAYRTPALVEVLCTATTADDKTETVQATVARNKLNQLSGNGLSSYALYELQKTGKCETKDIYGNTFIYELKVKAPATMVTDTITEKAEEVKNESN